MKFRCPYCHKTFGPEPHAECPHCRHTMTIPGKYLKSTRKEKIRAKAKIARDADRKRRANALTPVHDLNNKSTTMLIALAIIIVAGGLLLWGAFRIPKDTSPTRSRIDIAEDELYVLRVALELFKNDCGRYPTKEEHLEALVLNPGITNWGGHYVSLVSGDPWKRRYHYDVSTNGSVQLFSGGLDRISGTKDDVIAPELSSKEIDEQIKAREEYVIEKRGW